MKRWLAVVAGGFGLTAYVVSRRRAVRAAIEPAAELRARLARSRSAEEPIAPEPAAPDVPPAEPAGDELDARRRDVHERARQSLDELV